MATHPSTPRPIELPRCHVCGAYASERLTLPDGQVLYMCEDHFEAWLESQHTQ